MATCRSGATYAVMAWESEAAARWAALDMRARMRALNRAWCPACGRQGPMRLLGGRIYTPRFGEPYLLIRGQCGSCGTSVDAPAKP